MVFMFENLFIIQVNDFFFLNSFLEFWDDQIFFKFKEINACSICYNKFDLFNIFKNNLFYTRLGVDNFLTDIFLTKKFFFIVIEYK